jgi:hypothetical protein
MSGINLGKKGRAGVAIYLYVLYLVGRTDGLLSLGSRRSSTSTAPHERTAAVCSRRRVHGAAVFGTNLKTDRRGNGSSPRPPGGGRRQGMDTCCTPIRHACVSGPGFIQQANKTGAQVSHHHHLSPQVHADNRTTPALIPVPFSNGNEGSSFFAPTSLVIFSWIPSAWGSPCQTVVGCQRARGYPSPGWNVAGPHPETAGRCPSGPTLAFRGGELDVPLICQGQLLWGFFGAAAGAVFLFSSFSCLLPGVCRKAVSPSTTTTTTSTYSWARGPSHRLRGREGEKLMGMIWHRPACCLCGPSKLDVEGGQLSQGGPSLRPPLPA